MIPGSSDEAVARVRARLAVEVVDPPALARLLRTVPGGSEASVSRVRARLRQPAQRSLPSSLGWLAGAIAVAAVVVVVLGVRSRPTVLSAPLLAGASGELLRPTPGLELGVEGEGSLGGTTRAPTINWISGRLEVEVDPEAHLQVTVSTPDATVTVLGTHFVVERDPLGTTTSVERGHVRVACADGGHTTHDGGAAGGAELFVGERILCLPATASGLLGRARVLERGGDPGATLAAAEQGLAHAPSAAVRRELRLVQLGAFLALGRQGDALAATRAALAEPGELRRDELLDLAGSLSLAVEGCEAARVWLEERAGVSPAAKAALARCAAGP